MIWKGKTDTFSTTHMIHPTLMTMRKASEWRDEVRKVKREKVRNVSGKSGNMWERIFHQCNGRKNNNTAARMLGSRKGSFPYYANSPRSHTQWKNTNGTNTWTAGCVNTKRKSRESRKTLSKTARKSATKRKGKSGLNSEVNQGYFSSVFPLTQYVCALLAIP